MGIDPTPAGPSLPSATLEAAIGLGTLEAKYHETGAIRAARATSRSGGPTLVEVVFSLLERGPALESLDVVALRSEITPVWQAILAEPRPSLRWLRVAEADADGAPVSGSSALTKPPPHLLAHLDRALPALEVLVVEGPPMAASLGHGTLRELRLLGRPLKTLRAVRLPSLERLVWRLPANATDDGVGMPRRLVSPLWKPGALPKLRELDVFGIVLDDAMWGPEMVGSDLMSRLAVLRAPGIDDPKSLLPHLDRFRSLERFEVPWIDGSGADDLMRTLATLRVREHEESDENAGLEQGVVGDEAWILDWRGFNPLALRSFPDAVRALSLYSVHWDDEETIAFGKSAGERFERLRAPGERISGDPLVAGLSATFGTSRLTCLELTRARIGARSAEVLGEALPRARTLRSLSLSLDESASEAAAALARGLPGSALEELSLEGPWLAHEADGAILGKAVSASPIRSIALSLADAPPPSRGTPASGGALGTFMASLSRELYERIAIVHGEGPGDYAPRIPLTKALRWQRARVRGSASRGLGETFAAILSAQPQLRDLDLRESELMPDDVTAIAHAVAEHPSLESLRLSHVVMDEASMRLLAEAVRTSKTLTRLELFQDTSYNSRFRERFPYASIAPLIEAVAAVERTMVLETHGEGDDELGLIELVSANRLRGFGTSLRRENVARLAAALPSARGLASLFFRQSEIDEAGLAALVEALPRSSLRMLSFTRYFGIYALGKRSFDGFVAALAKTHLETLVAPTPRREFLALGDKMPSLRRFDIRRD